MSDSVSTRASDDGRPTPTGRSSGVPVDTELHIPAAAVEAAKQELWASGDIAEPEALIVESAIQTALEAMGATVESETGSGIHWPKGKRYRRIVLAWTPIEEGTDD